MAVQSQFRSLPLPFQPAAAPVRNLLDPAFEHDSCGVGFVARLSAEPSHKVVTDALVALARLAHRGAVAADGKSSDGVGLMTAIPRDFLLASTGLTLEASRRLGVGMVFHDKAESDSHVAIEQALAAQGITVLGWRQVPVRPEVLGEIALAQMPVVSQILVASGDAHADAIGFDRALYLARKQFERTGASGYICSLSSSVLVYKSMCAGRLLGEFYPDLSDPAFTSAFAIFHQRYATNVLPAWDRAQPLRTLAHNGEINTVWGNRARMDARAATLAPEFHPILTEDSSDSVSLDEAVELLAHNGRSVAEALRMLVPPANADRHSAFLDYSGDCVEPWDGPAALAFTDGRQIGAALDRNGLRPCRFFVTEDGTIIAGSEAGLVDLDPETIVHSGRLGPGQMIVADLERHKLLENAELLDLFDSGYDYSQFISADTPLTASIQKPNPLEPAELQSLQQHFGYSREDVRMILAPMATDGKDAIWSMGDDTPLAPLARSPRPLYAFFRQRFAQVTNPAIDSLREAIVVKLHTRLGPWPHILERKAALPGLSLSSPILSLGQMKALRTSDHPLAGKMPHAVLDCVFAPSVTLEAAVDDLCARAIDLVRGGAAVLLLTDRLASRTQLPVPMAMAIGAINQALTRAGVRTRVGLAVEAGDCRDVHHVAVLLGLGAGAVCPWLALETAHALDAERGEQNMMHALEAGLAKVMSKMGISVVDSYRSAHLFDIIGLNDEVVDRCFYGTPSKLSGVGFAEMDASLRLLWPCEEQSTPEAEGGESLTPSTPAVAARAAELPDYGWIRYRKANEAEPHSWQPQTVRALQTIVGSTRAAVAVSEPGAAWAAFTAQAVDPEPTVLRDLLEIRPAGPQLTPEQIEPVSSITPRFIASAMSLGSLSPEAHETITRAMNMLGGRSNTGEGGEDPAAYVPEPEGTPGPRLPLNNRIKQVASGRFGVTAQYLVNAEEIEIKVAQGAKPGEGGQLPSHKVTELIARLRHAQPGVSLISPPPHHDIYSIEDLAQLIDDLKRVNPRASIGVKLVSGYGVGTVAAGVAKAYADYIVIAGNTGGTGAAALTSIKYTGNPWEAGLAEAQQVLLQNGLRGRVRLRADGGLRTARDILIAALLGADEFAFGTSVLVALGCDMARQCHLNTCPTGIATQRPDLRAKFRGKPEHVVRYFEGLAHELHVLLASLGFRSLAEATGRTDLLEQVRHDGGLDLAAVLAAPAIAQATGTPIRWQGSTNARPVEHPPLDEQWLEPAMAAWRAGRPYSVESVVTNEDRTLGARLSGQIALESATFTPPQPSDLSFTLTGVAGQSFGAFSTNGIRLQLNGLANDFVGKGLCGAELVLRGQGRVARESDRHVILGNVALYGATSGSLFAAGRAGERFAVRNSGALAVVEGVGDHGCEYMTGGTVVVLGAAGINFGAGMTGGLAWIYDEEGNFRTGQHYHPEFLQAEAWAELDEESQAGLRSLVERHAAKTLSSKAKALLANWEAEAGKFLRLTPHPQA